MTFPQTLTNIQPRQSASEIHHGTVLHNEMEKMLVGPGVYNVKGFGAKGDNSTDDAWAIQAAINAAGGGLVFVPAGTYIAESTIVLTDNTTLVGIGTGSVIKAKNGLNANLISANPSAANTYFVRLKNLRIDGNKANNTSGYAVHMFRAHTWLVEELHIQNGADRDINVEGDATGFSLNNMIRNSRIEGAKGITISIGNYSPNNMLSDSIIGGSDTSDVLNLQNDELLVHGCHIHSAAQNGVYINSKNLLFENNIIESSGNHGLFLDSNAIGSRVIGNLIFNNGLTVASRDGIRVKTTDAVIMGNRAFDRQGTMTQDYGINLEATSTRNLVIGNHARASENQTGGILDSGTGNTLANNQTA